MREINPRNLKENSSIKMSKLTFFQFQDNYSSLKKTYEDLLNLPEGIDDINSKLKVIEACLQLMKDFIEKDSNQFNVFKQE